MYVYVNMGKTHNSTSRLRIRWSPKITTLMSVLLLLVHSAHSSLTCGASIKSYGETIPRGDIILEYDSGVPLVITCVLDPDNAVVHSQLLQLTDKTKFLSQRIVFYKYGERVPDQYVSVINPMKAQLIVPNPPPGEHIYSCVLQLDNDKRLYEQSTGSDKRGPPRLQEIGVCLNTVRVGYKPLPVTNFSCTSNGWVSMTCKWTKPENVHQTKYRLSFRLPGRVSNRYVYGCSSNSDVDDSTCYWDDTTQPIYRQLYEFYYFTLTGENEIGQLSTSFRLDHYANVIPASPNITVLDTTPSSAMLRWSVGIMIDFPRELIHKIEYTSQWDSDPEQWHTVNVSYICDSSMAAKQSISVTKPNCLTRDSKYYYFNVTDLNYPFSQYDFRVYVRSSVAREEDMWSAPGFITVNTKPTIPRRPPQTFIGGFQHAHTQVEGFRDVYIYWQDIKDSEKCGDSFEYYAYYSATTEDNQTMLSNNLELSWNMELNLDTGSLIFVVTLPEQVTFERFQRIFVNQPSDETYANYAKFSGLYTNTAYWFAVYSSNSEGFSTDYSTVFVPSEEYETVFDQVVQEAAKRQQANQQSTIDQLLGI